MSKVIFVLCDGLRYDAAIEMMGYLEHLVEAGLAIRYKMMGELPTISRPMYETIHTGTPVSVHGVTSNWVVRPSKMPNVFSIAHEHGKTTAASAYWWFSELYNGCPYHPGADKETDDTAFPIQHGRFYTTEAIPDEEIFNDGQVLLGKFDPDYLLIHPMGMDYMGHTFGPESNQYRNNAILIDTILATNIPGWLDKGYEILVSSDHGISKNNSHGGPTPETRDVPFYYIGSRVTDFKEDTGTYTHLNIAPTILKLMELPIPSTMKLSSLIK